jgi:transposase-like protein
MNKREEKQSIIAAYLSGEASMRKLGIQYGYGHVTIHRWIMAHKKYGRKQPLAFSKQVLNQEKLTTVEELQEALRLSRIKVELLEAMIDISDEKFGTDIRKKAGPSQS